MTFISTPCFERHHEDCDDLACMCMCHFPEEEQQTEGKDAA